MKVSSTAKDNLAKVVLERYRRAKDFKESYTVHQGLSFSHLVDRSEHQYRREYTPCDAGTMYDTFGFTPTRYYGLTQIKTNATKAWKRDLTISKLDNMFTVAPSPIPSLDKASEERVRAGVRRELVALMIESGVASPELLLTENGDPAAEVEDFLRDQVRNLKRVERARLMALAMDASEYAKAKLRDILVEGGFRQQYGQFTHNQVLHGMGVMKFPEYRRIPVLKHQGGKVNRVFDVRPHFRSVDVRNIYSLSDGPDLQTGTGVIERTSFSKAELINLARTEGYDKQAIIDILEEFKYRSRNWLDQEYTEADYWTPDEAIPALIHEGMFSGSELADYKITGLDPLDYVNASLIVVGGRTIRAKLLKEPKGPDRSYFAVPFIRMGECIYDVLGMGAMLWDTEQRVNRMMHVFESNLDWAARPPLMKNAEAFQDPTQADNISPGGQYEVEDSYAASGRMPDPLRPMSAVSAQYHLIYTQIATLLRGADEECGVPAFAYGAQDFGRASLGEYSQRMSNALRTIKEAALEEDIWFIEPAFEGMFARLIQEDPLLAESQDVDLQIRGISGLIEEDLQQERQGSAIGFLLQANQTPGLVPEQAVRYGVREFLASAGFPVDLLGFSDPSIDAALAAAASAAPTTGMAGGGQQVPQLDGRSGPIAQGAVAQADGTTNYGF